MVIVTPDQMRQVEEYTFRFGLDALRLMENAGARAASLAEEAGLCAGKQVAILCGRGNNGGDACVMARHLLQKGNRVTLILCEGQPVTKQASRMFERLQGLELEILNAGFDKSAAFRRISGADLIVDGVYGIGFHGNLQGLTAQLIEEANRTNAVRLSLDLPSGMNGETGETDPGVFRADFTVVFGAYKTGHFTDGGRRCCGRLLLAEIGIPAEAFFKCQVDAFFTDVEMVKQSVPKRDVSAHKGDFGRALLLCGSRRMSGAAFLAASGALKAGAGLVTLAAPGTVVDGLCGRLIEATFLPLPEEDGFVSIGAEELLLAEMKNKTALLAGCGLGRGEAASRLIEGMLMGQKNPVVLDADGLFLAAEHKDEWKAHRCPLILTPHAGEMERLTGEKTPTDRTRRKEVCRQLAEEWNAVVVLKGHETVISGPDGSCYLNQTGNPGLAKGGSGDLLAGLICGLAAQGIEPVKAAAIGVWLHGKAADLAVAESGEAGLLASELLPSLGKVWAMLKR